MELFQKEGQVVVKHQMESTHEKKQASNEKIAMKKCSAHVR